jgi:hypothetical protein
MSDRGKDNSPCLIVTDIQHDITDVYIKKYWHDLSFQTLQDHDL